MPEPLSEHERPLRTAEERWEQADRLRPQLMAFALRLVDTYHDAQDLVSEAVAATHGSTATSVRSLHAFLQAVIENRAISELRRRHSPARTARLANTTRTVELDPAALVCDRAEDAWLLHVAEAVLTPDERQVVQLRGDGMSMQAIASRLGISYESAKARLRGARGKLRARYAETLGLLPALLAGVRQALNGWRPVRRSSALAAAPLVVAGLVVLVGQAPAPPERQGAAPPQPSPTVAAYVRATPTVGSRPTTSPLAVAITTAMPSPPLPGPTDPNESEQAELAHGDSDGPQEWSCGAGNLSVADAAVTAILVTLGQTPPPC